MESERELLETMGMENSVKMSKVTVTRQIVIRSSLIKLYHFGLRFETREENNTSFSYKSYSYLEGGSVREK